jgi:putative GTP pyrophosphokinase
MDITDIQPAVLNRDTIIRQADSLLDSMLNYKELMLGYSSAMRQIRTKLDILSTEFEVKYQRNPISAVQMRLKSQASVMEKMARKGLPLTIESIEQNLDDIAGVRVICCYVDDIYRIADALTAQETLS